MGSKVILVIVDGLAWEVARTGMGYLLALRESGRASLYRMECELPSLSRPLYECILTGVAPVESGVVHNDVRRLTSQTGIFHLAAAAGLVTAAAAYHWVSELYNRTPFDAGRDRFTDDASLPIQHGIFYHSDDYPDAYSLLDGEHLRRKHVPDFLLIHPMGVDDAGHRHGLDSMQYRNAVRHVDMLLSVLMPTWLAEGYQVLVTGDHGMSNDLRHGGALPEERLVPLFLAGSRFSGGADVVPRQTQLCGLMADLLAVPHDKPGCPELLV
ncbi:MAG: alkaline phosphatase family protein [Sideroxydans sp.]|nr:alkaline phosphatase family protein [Sideroxydans sp.]